MAVYVPSSFERCAGGLDPEALVSGRYDTRSFKLTPRTKMIFAGRGVGRRVRVDTEAVIHLPNGHKVRVHTDGGGYATHITEADDRTHAVARPDTLALRMQPGSASDRRRERPRSRRA